MPPRRAPPPAAAAAAAAVPPAAPRTRWSVFLLTINSQEAAIPIGHRHTRAALRGLLRGTFNQMLSDARYQWLRETDQRGHQIHAPLASRARDRLIAALRSVRVTYSLETGPTSKREHIHAFVVIRHQTRVQIDRHFIARLFATVFGHAVHVDVKLLDIRTNRGIFDDILDYITKDFMDPRRGQVQRRVTQRGSGTQYKPS